MKGNSMYPYLSSPITINSLTVRNRIIYPALGVLYSYDRKLNDRYYHFFEEKARGGAGIVTVGPVGVDFIGSGIIVLSLAEDEAIPSFVKLTSLIKEQGAAPWIQLFHAGAYSHPFIIDGKEPIAPSPIFSKYSKATPREMTREDIETVQTAFVRAALRAKEAGFAGVEIIASGGYLITQFVSPLRNQRTDQYGGTFENRMRFPRELIERLREKLGPDYPLTIRMAGNDFVPGSNTDAETPAIAQVYEKAGVDLINVTGGWHETKVPQLPMDLPRSGFSYLAANIKKVVSVPVVASNRISDPDAAEKILQDGCADMVSLGRVLIADPYWPQKAFQGKKEEIRPCVACSQGCTDEIFSGKPVFCTGNPMAGFEGERKIKKTAQPQKVMVIGAGAAGLEAAVTASIAGHQVTVYEKGNDIGGQLYIAGAPPHKNEIWEFIRYYRAMIRKYNIPVRLNTAVDRSFIQNEKPDHIIVAEGAEALIPPIQGVDDPCVLSAWDVLKNNPLLGKNVAIIGGGAVGLETALFVADRGTIRPDVLHFLFAYDAEPIDRLRDLMFHGTSQVTVFEMLPKVGKDVGKSTKWVLFGNLEKHGIQIRTQAKVCSIHHGTVVYETDGKTEKMQFDNVILASGSRPVQRLSKEIAELGIPYKTVGDCVQVGKINDAIHGGFLAALDI
ncbi:MAG: FAD-binding protein [Desulfobacteraceae bacterium]|nr:MAG: FAD-binding protein [Desulfobacteraceae bacterium]